MFLYRYIHRSNPHRPQQLYLNDKQKLAASNFNKDLPTIVYIHGFTESTNGDDGQSGHAIRDGLFF